MKVTITGATGRVGVALVERLRARGDEVTVLSRSGQRALDRLPAGVEAVAWDAKVRPAPADALTGRHAVVHLAGEDVGQRWTEEVKREIRDSRELGTRNLVEGLAAAQPRPGLLVSASGSNYYGARGDERVDEAEGPGYDFLAQVCVAWEREARRAQDHGVRVVTVRTGPVLDKAAGALAKMLTPFRLGVGGPVAGGDQYLPWIHREDVVGLYLAVLDSTSFQGAINASAPEPVTNKTFAKALGRTIRRPALMPVPGFAIRALYGEMAQLVTEGVRMIPGRAPELGYTFAHPDLDEALRDTLC